MTRRPPAKSRARAEAVRVVIHPPQQQHQDRYAETPGYSGHNGGSFGDAGYRAGTGVFGFRQNVT